MSPTLEPTDAEREMDFWRSFNPKHSVGEYVFKFEGGEGDEKEPIHSHGDGQKREEDQEKDEEEVVHKETDKEGRQET